MMYRLETRAQQTYKCKANHRVVKRKEKEFNAQTIPLQLVFTKRKGKEWDMRKKAGMENKKKSEVVRGG